MSDRNTFLGCHTTENVKNALESEARRRNVSMSLLAHEILLQGLQGVSIDPVRLRRGAIRGHLAAPFRQAILASRVPRAQLAHRVGFTDELRRILRNSVVMTVKTQLRLEELARIINYRGPLIEEAA